MAGTAGKYHINAKGEAEKCTATKKPCPYGATGHYDTPGEAKTAMEKIWKEKALGETGSGSPKLSKKLDKKNQLKAANQLGHGMSSVLFHTDVKNELIEHYEEQYPDSGWDDGFAWIVPTTGMKINLDYGDPMLPMNKWVIKLTDTVPEDYHLDATCLELTGDDVDTALDLEAENANKPVTELTVMENVHAMTELVDGLIEDARKRRVETLGVK